jgi:hypothetical protein
VGRTRERGTGQEPPPPLIEPCARGGYSLDGGEQGIAHGEPTTAAVRDAAGARDLDRELEDLLAEPVLGAPPAVDRRERLGRLADEIFALLRERLERIFRRSWRLSRSRRRPRPSGASSCDARG